MTDWLGRRDGAFSAAVIRFRRAASPRSSAFAAFDAQPIKMSQLAISSQEHVIANKPPSLWVPASTGLIERRDSWLKNRIIVRFVWAAFANRQKSPTFA